MRSRGRRRPTPEDVRRAQARVSSLRDQAAVPRFPTGSSGEPSKDGPGVGQGWVPDASWWETALDSTPAALATPAAPATPGGRPAAASSPSVGTPLVAPAPSPATPPPAALSTATPPSATSAPGAESPSALAPGPPPAPPPPVGFPGNDEAARLRERFAQAVADRLPLALRGASVVPSRRAVAGLLVLSLAVIALTGWLLLRNGPRSVSVGVRPVSRTLPTPTASPSPVKMVLVDVAGKVRRPGVVTLPLGSRVADALRAAGGLLPGVDVGLLNLARPLADGEQVVVGLGGTAAVVPPSGGRSGAGSAGSVLDLNTATVDDFDGLPGVGPVLAQRIVDWRTAHGPFTTVDQLREVSGIGDRRFEDLKARVRV